MVTMRIESVRGVPVREAKGVPRWVLRREFRSTYRDAMNATETLIAGEWHKTRARSERPGAAFAGAGNRQGPPRRTSATSSRSTCRACRCTRG